MLAVLLAAVAFAVGGPPDGTVIASDPGGGWCQNGDYWWQPSPAPGFYFCINNIPVYLGP